MPPSKKSTQILSSYPSSSECYVPSSSPLELSDDGRSSATLTENLDERVSSFVDSSSDESQTSQSHSNGVLTSVENTVRKSPFRKQASKRIPITASERECPLPRFTWADSRDVWKRLYERDSETAEQRSANLLNYHPSLKLRMRAILLDWINEVCDVYKLHRETFHLCLHYIDRYLSNTRNVNKNRLQLIGITCLFIASKVEEVYPPKIVEFAYVTDGACTAEDILLEEIVILNTLDWNVSPITVNYWLNIYLQLCNEIDSEKPSQPTLPPYKYTGDHAFLFTQYSSLDFVLCARLIDLAVLHIGVNAFKNSQLAAAAVAYTFDKDIAMRVSGYTWSELEPCFLWLEPFSHVLNIAESNDGMGDSLRTLPHCSNKSTSIGGLSHICPNINLNQSHRVQVHNISLDFFDRVEGLVDFMNEIN